MILLSISVIVDEYITVVHVGVYRQNDAVYFAQARCNWVIRQISTGVSQDY